MQTQENNEDSSLLFPQQDVFYAGHLQYKPKGTNRYRSLWGVLRFESATGPRRLELYYQDRKVQPNANTYPLSVIELNNILGLHLDRTIRPGLFPLQMMTTDRKYQFATNSREEQQDWLSKMSRLLFGPPLPERVYEFPSMVFPTKHSETLNLRGSYLIRVTMEEIHLISQGNSNMSYNIPLQSVMNSQHMALSNPSIPFTTNRLFIKVLFLSTGMNCDMGPGNFAFVTTSAPNIAKVISNRLLRFRKLPPLPPQISTPTPKSEDKNGQAEILQLQPTATPIKSRSYSHNELEYKSANLALRSGMEPGTHNSNGLCSKLSLPSLSGDSTRHILAKQRSISNTIRPKSPLETDYRVSTSKIPLNDTKPRSALKTPAADYHPKRKLAIIQMKKCSSDSRDKLKSEMPQNTLPLLKHISKQDRVKSLSLDNNRTGRMSQFPDRDFQDDDDVQSYTSDESESSSHDYDDIVIMDSIKNESTYVNLRCVICSKKHNWNDEVQCPHSVKHTSGESNRKWATISQDPPEQFTLRKSCSTEGILEAHSLQIQQSKYHNSQSIGSNFELYLDIQERRHQQGSTQNAQGYQNSYPLQKTNLTRTAQFLKHEHTVVQSEESTQQENKCCLSLRKNMWVNSHHDKLHKPLQRQRSRSLKNSPQSLANRIPDHILSHPGTNPHRQTTAIKEREADKSYNSIKGFGPYEQVPTFLNSIHSGHTPLTRSQNNLNQPTNTKQDFPTGRSVCIKRHRQYGESTKRKRQGVYGLTIEYSQPGSTQEGTSCMPEKDTFPPTRPLSHNSSKYESIPNSGPYETIKRKLPPFLKSIKKSRSTENLLTSLGMENAEQPIQVLQSKFRSTEDLLTSKVVPMLQVNSPPLAAVCSNSKDLQESGTNKITNIQQTPKTIHKVRSVPDLTHKNTACYEEQFHSNHHIMNLASPEDLPDGSSMALPYAMVWLDRIL